MDRQLSPAERERRAIMDELMKERNISQPQALALSHRLAATRERDAEVEGLRGLVTRLYEERNRNCEIAVGLAERVHHELQDYGGYVRAVDELVGDDDAEVDAALSQHDGDSPSAEPSTREAVSADDLRDAIG